MFAERDKHYPSRSGQSSLATAVTNLTKHVTEINSGPGTQFIRVVLKTVDDNAAHKCSIM